MDRGVDDMDGLSGKTQFSGLLEKVTKTVFKSKKKMCVLTDREFLLYADNKAQGSPKSINLQDIQAVKRVNSSKSFQFEITTKQRTETFATDSLDLCQQWIKALQTALLNKRRTSSISSVSDPVPNRQSYAKGHAYETVDLDEDSKSPQIKNADRDPLPVPPSQEKIPGHMYETVDLNDGESPRITEQTSRPLCQTVDANNGPYASADVQEPVSRPLCKTVDANNGPYSSLYDEKQTNIPSAGCRNVPDIVVYSEPSDLKKSDLYVKSKEIHNMENKNGSQEDGKTISEGEVEEKSVERKSQTGVKTVLHMTYNEAYGDVGMNGSDKLYSEIDPSQQTEALEVGQTRGVYSLAGEPDLDPGSIRKSVGSSKGAKVLVSKVETNGGKIYSDADSRRENLSTPDSVDRMIAANGESISKSNNDLKKPTHSDTTKKAVQSNDTTRDKDSDSQSEEVYDDIMNAEFTPIPSLTQGPLPRDDAIIQLDRFLRECRGYSAMYASVVKKADRQSDGESVVKNLREFFTVK